MPYQISTQRGELFYSLMIDQARSAAADDAARGIIEAFEAASATHPSYGTFSVDSSITYVTSVTTITTDTVPLTV